MYSTFHQSRTIEIKKSKIRKKIYIKSFFFIFLKNPNKNPEIKKIKPCIKDPDIGSSLKKLIILEPYG